MGEEMLGICPYKCRVCVCVITCIQCRDTLVIDDSGNSRNPATHPPKPQLHCTPRVQHWQAFTSCATSPEREAPSPSRTRPRPLVLFISSALQLPPSKMGKDDIVDSRLLAPFLGSRAGPFRFDPTAAFPLAAAAFPFALGSSSSLDSPSSSSSSSDTSRSDGNS